MGINVVSENLGLILRFLRGQTVFATFDVSAFQSEAVAPICLTAPI